MDRPKENLQDIRRRLEDAKRQFDAPEMKPRESLRDFEYRVSFEREVKSLQKNSRKGSVLRTKGNYLLKHSRSGHMNYAQARREKLPIGSGVIESTIRRVVHLGLKGASAYWKERSVEDMLLLRCLYKANRWQNIEKQGLAVLPVAP